MTKRFFISCFSLVISYCSIAQSVGIGTSTPAFKLDVKNGSINTDSVYRIAAVTVLSVKGAGNFFAGRQTGSLNTGTYNTMAGEGAGSFNTGNFNSFFGNQSGDLNQGNSNTYYGYRSGFNSVTGDNITLLGAKTSLDASNLSYATAIGSDAHVACSNCLALGGTKSDDAQTRVGINNYFPVADLHIIQESDASGDVSRGIRLQRLSGGNRWRIYADGSNLLTFEYNDGGAGSWGWINNNGSFVNGSDIRSKKNIQQLDTHVLDKILQLQPKKYLFNRQAADEKYSYGFIAQEVLKIFPEFVSEREDGYLGITYSSFGVVAIKAIQEQQQLIEDQQKQIKDLKKQNDQHQKLINDLVRRVDILEPVKK